MMDVKLDLVELGDDWENQPGTKVVALNTRRSMIAEPRVIVPIKGRGKYGFLKWCIVSGQSGGVEYVLNKPQDGALNKAPWVMCPVNSYTMRNRIEPFNPDRMKIVGWVE